MPHTRSSYVMAQFDTAGFELGDVDRRVSDRYPSGRLELWPLARLTSGKPKDKPLPREEWPEMDLSAVQVAKAMPAWVPILEAHGFNYWVACSRGGLIGHRMDCQEVVNSYRAFSPHELWARACEYVIQSHSQQHSDGDETA